MKFLLGHNAAGLFLDPGLGKTSITLGALKILKKEKLVKKVLLIAPLRVCYSVWPKEIQKWREFGDLKVAILHGPHKEEALLEEADIYLINPEGLVWLFKNDGENFFQLNPDSLVIDESSKFKHTQTQRYKALKPYLKHFTRRWILTGSPTPNGLLDLFGQMYILDLGHALSPYITQYRRLYFDPAGYGGYDWKLKPDGAERINKAIKPLILRLEDKDYLELPELISNNIFVDLPEAAMKIYNEMERRMFTKLENGEIVSAANAGVATMKCSQIANGGLYKLLDVESPLVKCDQWEHLHMAKAEATADLVDELEGEPALIAYEFAHDLERLQDVLGKDTPFIGGGVSAKRGAELEKDWNAGRLTKLLCQPQSVAHGLNLQEAGHHVIWASLIWNYEEYYQLIRRIRRQGSKAKRVFSHHLIARNTIDEVKLRVLTSKGKVQYDFLTALKDYAKEKRK